MDASEAITLIYQALASVNELRPAGSALPAEADLVLVGDDGALDSLALTVLILGLEERIAAATGREVSLLTDEDFEDQIDSFRTPSSLAQFVCAKTAP